MPLTAGAACAARPSSNSTSRGEKASGGGGGYGSSPREAPQHLPLLRRDVERLVRGYREHAQRLVLRQERKGSSRTDEGADEERAPLLWDAFIVLSVGEDHRAAGDEHGVAHRVRPGPPPLPALSVRLPARPDRVDGAQIDVPA